jgi:hypothetical protein
MLKTLSVNILEALFFIMRVFVKRKSMHSLLRSFTVEPSASASYAGSPWLKSQSLERLLYESFCSSPNEYWTIS